MAHLREAHAKNLWSSQREVIAFLSQIGREEDGEEDLGQLRGLEGEAAQADPDAGAVSGLAKPGHHGQQQQADARHQRNPHVIPQNPVISQQQHGEGHEHDTHHGELQLALDRARFIGQIDAIDHRQPEPVQQQRRREKNRIGVGGAPPNREVCHGYHHARHGRDGGEVVRKPASAGADVHEEVGE